MVSPVNYVCHILVSFVQNMMTSSNGNIFRATDPLCGEFTGHPSQRPVTRSFDVFFDPRLNKRLSKQSWGWWFETPWRSSWRHCNAWASWLRVEVTDAWVWWQLRQPAMDFFSDSFIVTKHIVTEAIPDTQNTIWYRRYEKQIPIFS